MSGVNDLYQDSARRDAWRAQLLHEQVREEMKKRRDAAALRGAIALGVVMGVLGSFATYLL